MEPINCLSFQVEVEGEVRRTTQTRPNRSAPGWLKDLAASADHGVWAVLSSSNGGSWLARFDGQQWETHALESSVRSVAEINSGIVLSGVDDHKSGSGGLRKVTWDAKKVEPSAGPEGAIFEIIKLPNGQIVAASWWDLYQLDAAGKDDSPSSWEIRTTAARHCIFSGRIPVNPSRRKDWQL